MTVPVSLQKCLESVLDRSQARRYIRNSDTKGVMPSRYYYNTSLRDLNAKDSEGAIHNLIMALDTEANHEPSLHLVKTMLFGLSKKFDEAGGESYKVKFASLSNWILSIEKSISDNERQILSLKNERSKQTNKGLWGVLQKVFFKKSIKDYDLLAKELLNKKQDLKKQLAFAAKLSQIGEYAKVLSLVLEICLYPARYAWVIA